MCSPACQAERTSTLSKTWALRINSTLKYLNTGTVKLNFPEQFIHLTVAFSCQKLLLPTKNLLSAKLGPRVYVRVHVCVCVRVWMRIKALASWQLPSQRWVSSVLQQGWELPGEKDRQVFPSCSRKWAKPCPKLWLQHFVVWRKPLLIAQAIGFLLWANSFGFTECCQGDWKKHCGEPFSYTAKRLRH